MTVNVNVNVNGYTSRDYGNPFGSLVGKINKKIEAFNPPPLEFIQIRSHKEKARSLTNTDMVDLLESFVDNMGAFDMEGDIKYLYNASVAHNLVLDRVQWNTRKPFKYFDKMVKTAEKHRDEIIKEARVSYNGLTLTQAVSEYLGSKEVDEVKKNSFNFLTALDLYKSALNESTIENKLNAVYMNELRRDIKEHPDRLVLRQDLLHPLKK